MCHKGLIRKARTSGRRASPLAKTQYGTVEFPEKESQARILGTENDHSVRSRHWPIAACGFLYYSSTRLMRTAKRTRSLKVPNFISAMMWLR